MIIVRFTLAYWCILAAVLLPLLCAALAKAGSYKLPLNQGGFNNQDPRAWLARQSDWRARANAAQANGFEALPFFIGAVIVAHLLGAPQARLDLLALLFVFMRIIYCMMYVAGLATFRSIAWGVAFALNVAILFTGYR